MKKQLYNYKKILALLTTLGITLTASGCTKTPGLKDRIDSLFSSDIRYLSRDQFKEDFIPEDIKYEINKKNLDINTETIHVKFKDNSSHEYVMGKPFKIKQYSKEYGSKNSYGEVYEEIIDGIKYLKDSRTKEVLVSNYVYISEPIYNKFYASMNGGYDNDAINERNGWVILIKKTNGLFDLVDASDFSVLLVDIQNISEVFLLKSYSSLYNGPDNDNNVNKYMNGQVICVKKNDIKYIIDASDYKTVVLEYTSKKEDEGVTYTDNTYYIGKNNDGTVLNTISTYLPYETNELVKKLK